MIEGWNSLIGLYYVWVVDYMDYLVLLVLILAYCYSLVYVFDWKVWVFYVILFFVAVFVFLAMSILDEYDFFFVLDEIYEFFYGKNEFVLWVDVVDSLFIEYGLLFFEGLEVDMVNISYYVVYCGGY